MLGLLVPMSPAVAHTQVQDATPGPGAVVEGRVDVVEIEWLDPLLRAPEIIVSAPDGSPVRGLRPAELVEPDVARAAFDPLTESGTYQVTYRFASLDGAPQEGAHTFRFEAAGAGLALRPLAAAAVGAVALALLLSAARARSRQTP